MSSYDQLTELIDTVIEQLQREIMTASQIIADQESLSPWMMTSLARANAQATAAHETRTLISTATDTDFASVLSTVKNNLTEAYRAPNETRFAVASFYEAALSVLDHP